jgi:PBP1b-binding outer membrane lipoprotein LpoB
MNLRFLGLVFPLMLVGCATAPEPSVRYVDPGAQGRVAGTGIESQDIAAAAQAAATSILQLPQIANASQPPVVIITPVVNRSASPIDTSLYTTKLRGALMEYGGGKVRFLARDAAAKTNEREQQLRESGAVQSGGTAGGKRVGATYDYVLATELQGIATATREGKSDYFLVSFKLVDFSDLLVWERQYEIKKEGRESGVYR